LLEVVELQRTLFDALCALPDGTSVDLAWLTTTWSNVTDGIWLRQFWENDNGNRANWTNVISAAPTSLKQEIIDLMEEQFRFEDLYLDTPTVRLRVQSWKVRKLSTGVERIRGTLMEAVKDLLESFYAPLFYRSHGFPNQDGSRFHKDDFLGKPKICPYSDNKIQDAKLDHFLPKESFPFLSCHPDNLIPCSTDPNSISRKGRYIPLQPDESDQAAEWFHPRFRPAKDKYNLTFDENRGSGPQVRFVARSPLDQPRLSRMAGMFGLVEFWSRDLDDELQLVSAEVRETIVKENLANTEEEVRRCLEGVMLRKRKRIGHDSLAIVTAAFYEYILSNSNRFSQVVRSCQD
jgi:hypothetical protein